MSNDRFASAHEMVREYAELEEKMADPSIHEDQANARKLGRRYAQLGPVVAGFKAWKSAEDDLLAVVLDAGAEEINDLGETFEIISDASAVVKVRQALQGAKIDYESADTPFLPTMSVELDADGANKVFALIEAIEDCDDVQNVFANFDVSDEVMATL